MLTLVNAVVLHEPVIQDVERKAADFSMFQSIIDRSGDDGFIVVFIKQDLHYLGSISVVFDTQHTSFVFIHHAPPCSKYNPGRI